MNEEVEEVEEVEKSHLQDVKNHHSKRDLLSV